jgi:hypothetical protein
VDSRQPASVACQQVIVSLYFRNIKAACSVVPGGVLCRPSQSPQSRMEQEAMA